MKFKVKFYKTWADVYQIAAKKSNFKIQKAEGVESSKLNALT